MANSPRRLALLFAVVLSVGAVQGVGVAGTGPHSVRFAGASSGPNQGVVVPLAGNFNPPHFDFGSDGDGNGLYDFLVVNASVTVDTPNFYVVGGFLHANTFPPITFNQTFTFLEVGASYVDVFFEGSAINASGVDGPYTVDLSLSDAFGNSLDSDVHMTEPYNHTEFDGPSAEFAPPHADSGIDSDGDGLFNALTVDVSVTVHRSGTYLVLGTLHNANNSLSVESLVFGAVDPGPWTASVPFPGYVLNASGVDGPYIVELALLDLGRLKFLGLDRHDTSLYDNRAFEEFPVISAPYALRPGPTIDGAIEEGEWSAAYVEDLAAIPGNELSALLMVMNDQDFAYIAYDAVGDTTSDPTDAGSISFDTGNDGVPTDGHEDQFVLGGGFPGDQAHLVYDESFGFWVVDDTPHEGLASRRGFGPSPASDVDHRMYEFRIPLSLLGAQAGSSLGFFGASQEAPGVLDNHTALPRFSVWPALFGPIPLGMYGDLTLSESPDAVPPTITITSPDQDSVTNSSSVPIAWTASDEGSGLAEFHVTIDENLAVVLPADATEYTATGLVDGSHTIMVTAFDRAGNSQSDSRNVTVDASAPTLGITAPAEGAALNSTTVIVSWSASDPGTGISKYEIGLDRGEPFVLDPGTTTYTFDGLSEGEHVVDLTAFDSGGLSTSAERMFVVDTTDPSVEITGPTDEFLASHDVQVSWSAGDAGSGLEEIQVSIDGGAPTLLSGTSTTFTFPGVADGSHVIRVTAVDAAGNTASDSVTVTVDTTDPTVAVNPIDDVLSSDDVQVSWSAGDAGSGLEGIQVSLDDSAPILLAGTSTSHTFPDVSDGNHMIRITAVDAAGNTASDSVTVTVDTTNPTVAIEFPAQGGVVTSSEVTLIFTKGDATSGIARLEVSLDGLLAVGLDGTATSHRLTGLSDGEHTVGVTVFDGAGNSATRTVTFRVDTSVLSPSGPYGYTGLGLVAALLIGALVAMVAIARMRRKARPPSI